MIRSSVCALSISRVTGATSRPCVLVEHSTTISLILLNWSGIEKATETTAATIAAATLQSIIDDIANLAR